MNVSTRQLRAFIATAHHLSFSRAAEACFMTQSGLSILIRELEAQLGFRLFNRTTRQMSLTPHGQRFLETAERFMRGLDADVMEILQSSDEANRVVSVGAPPMTCAHFLPAAIAAFRRQTPECRVRLFDGDLNAISAKVLSGDLDIGLGMYMKPIPELESATLMRLPLIAVWPEGHCPSDADALDWAQLADHSLIGLPPDNPMQQRISKSLGNVLHHRPPDLVVNYIDTQLALAEAGEGVAIVPGWVRRACVGRQVVVTELINPTVEVDFLQVRARGRQLGKTAAGFLDFLRAFAQTPDVWNRR